MTTSELKLTGHTVKTDQEADAPFPVVVCWMIWTVAAVTLWGLVLTPFFI